MRVARIGALLTSDGGAASASPVLRRRLERRRGSGAVAAAGGSALRLRDTFASAVLPPMRPTSSDVVCGERPISTRSVDVDFEEVAYCSDGVPDCQGKGQLDGTAGGAEAEETLRGISTDGVLRGR